MNETERRRKVENFHRMGENEDGVCCMECSFSEGHTPRTTTTDKTKCRVLGMDVDWEGTCEHANDRNDRMI